MKTSVLIVEDDNDLRQAMLDSLKISGISALGVNSIAQAIVQLSSKNFSLIISDMNMGNSTDGLDLLATVNKMPNKTPVVIVTAFSSVDNAVKALKLGAKDYFTKPFLPEKLIDMVQRYAISINNKQTDNYPLTNNKKMEKILALSKRVAKTKVTVLIQGESGTGKEVLAKYIHQQSENLGEFVAINCAAIPENMLESLLFGFEKGAFTGAHQTVVGKFELANKGTLFLDEISEMPINLQTKILRAIQGKEIERLGSKKTIPLDIRIIAASNKDLRQEVSIGNFRQDLFYRLSVFPINIIPLRDRVEDIPLLCNSLLKKYADGAEYIISDNAMQYLKNKQWLGNIRELENILQRAIIICKNNTITAEDIQHDAFDDISMIKNNNNDAIDIDNHLKRSEYQTIIEVLKTHNGCRKNSAKELGISDRTLRNKLAKMKECGITIPKSGA